MTLSITDMASQQNWSTFLWAIWLMQKVVRWGDRVSIITSGSGGRDLSVRGNIWDRTDCWRTIVNTTIVLTLG